MADVTQEMKKPAPDKLVMNGAVVSSDVCPERKPYHCTEEEEEAEQLLLTWLMKEALTIRPMWKKLSEHVSAEPTCDGHMLGQVMISCD